MWENALPGHAMERMTIDVVAGEPAPPPPRGRALRALALVAGALFLFGLWARGLPAFVAWEVAGDHQRCFGRRHLPARVWSSEPAEIQGWLESRGTPAPPLPKEAGQAPLAGARYCPLWDRVAAHVYYGGDGSGIVSVFLLVRPGPHRRRLVRHVPRAPRAAGAHGRTHARGRGRECGRRRRDRPLVRHDGRERAPAGRFSG